MQKKNIWKWLAGCAALLVAIALIVSGMVLDMSYFAERNVALTVGNHEVTAAVYNYFYRTTYAQMESEYGAESLSYLADYITDQANNHVRDTYAIYDAAVAAGEALTEEEQKQLNDDIELLRETATNLGAADLDEFIEASYGLGCNEENYREFMQIQMLANKFSQKEQDTFNAELTQEKFDAYYRENILNFDTVTFRYFLVPVDEGRDIAATEELAKTMETKIHNDVAGFEEMARELAIEEEKEFYEEENSTLISNEKINYVDENLRDWMADASRTEGNTLVVRAADEIGTYVACFLSRDNNDYNAVNVRHILVSLPEHEHSEQEDEQAHAAALAEAMQTAKETAEGYLAEYNAGEKTEEAFAELAKAHSEDNAENGGLYENVTKGQMVRSFNDWCFDAARKPGDTGIVETEYGYHVMYFVGEGENARYKMVTDEMKTNHQTAWVMKLTEGYEVKVNESGMSYTTRLQAQ